MKETFITVTNNNIYQSYSYTLFVLSTDIKRVVIFTEPQVGIDLQSELQNKTTSRPKTHSLLDIILSELTINPIQLLIHDVKDSIYFARLFLEQTIDGNKTILEIDVRPSDGLTIALKKNLPIYVTNELLHKIKDID